MCVCVCVCVCVLCHQMGEPLTYRPPHLHNYLHRRKVCINSTGLGGGGGGGGGITMTWSLLPTLDNVVKLSR